MEIITVPILQDNFAYLIVDTASRTCAAVDPSEPGKVIKAAQDRGLTITHVLTTHSHWDHAGGNSAMRSEIAGVEVCAMQQAESRLLNTNTRSPQHKATN